MGGLLDGIDTAKLMMGQNAFHISLNLIAQSYLPGSKVAGVFQTAHGLPLLHESKRSHVVIIGDAIIRPRAVFATDEFRGRGVSSLFTDGFLDSIELVKHGKADILLAQPR
jgi:hypothetical protein